MTKKPEHHWSGETPDPESFFGFCYQITNMVTGKMYIGKKQYYAAAGRRKYRPSDITSDKWRPDHWKESNWRRYTGSSKELNDDIKKLKKKSFTFEIISQHVSKAELHYAEVELQVRSDVLRAKTEDGERLYYNKNIAGTKFIPPDYHSEETRNKISKRHSGRTSTFLGRKHTEESKSLIGERSKERKAYLSMVRDTSGDKNPRYDNEVREWFNINTKSKECCTKYDLYTKYNLDKSSVNKLLAGDRQHVGGYQQRPQQGYQDDTPPF